MIDGHDPIGELNRRGVLRITGATLATISTGGTALAQQLEGGSEYQDIAWLIATEAARPEPEVFASYEEGHWVYWAIDTGAHYEIEDGDDTWAELPTHLPGYAVTDLPSGPANGTLYFDQNRNLPTWWDTDHYEYPNFVDDVLTEPVTVDNTTARTVVFDPDINANSLVKGRKYQIDLSGSFSTANNSAEFTIDINLAGATDAAGIGNVGGNVTDAPWNIEFAFTVREHGQNGVLQPHTKGLFNAEPADSDHGTVAVDTTSVTELSVDIQWNEADPENVVVVKQAHLKQMG